MVGIFVLLWGLILGLIVGSTSVGTGLIGTPALMFLFGLPPLYAVGTMSVAGTVMMTSGAVKHFKKGFLLAKIALPFMITSFPTAFVTGLYGQQINDVIPLKWIMGFLIIASSVFLLTRLLVKEKEIEDFQVQPWQVAFSPVLGILSGFLMGATSISGSIILLAFLIVLKLPERYAVGTASIVAGLTLAVSSVAHIISHNVDYHILIPLIPGVIGGAYGGAHLSHKIPVKVIRFALIIILLGAGVGLFFK